MTYWLTVAMVLSELFIVLLQFIIACLQFMQLFKLLLVVP